MLLDLNIIEMQLKMYEHFSNCLLRSNHDYVHDHDAGEYMGGWCAHAGTKQFHQSLGAGLTRTNTS